MTLRTRPTNSKAILRLQDISFNVHQSQIARQKPAIAVDLNLSSTTVILVHAVNMEKHGHLICWLR